MTAPTRLLLAVCLLLLTSQLRAQNEPMFTQYSFNELFINPAYAGSNEAMSISSVFREQWVNIDGAPSTKTLTAHSPFYNSRVGLGLTLYRDDIGVASQTGIFGNYSFKIPLDVGTLALGVLGGVSGYQERLLDVKTNTPDVRFSQNTPMFFVPNFGLGIYYYTKHYYFGLSAPRLMENTLIINQANAVERVDGKFAGIGLHYFLASGIILDVGQLVKIRPAVLIKAVVNAPVEFDFNLAALFVNTLWLGAGYRSGDALNFLSAVQINNQLRIGYSFDYTFTSLSSYAGGTHEFTLNYLFAFNGRKITSPRYF